MMMNKFLLTCAFVAGIAIPGQAQTFKTFPNDPVGMKQTVLDNGFTVMLIEDHDRPVVFGAVVVKAGGKNDPKDATGMAHYLEHMLFKGTSELGTIDYAKEKPILASVDSLYEVLGKTTDPEARKGIQKAINEKAVQAAAYAIPNEFDRLLASIGGTNLNAFTTEDQTVYHNAFPPSQIEKWCDIYAHRFQHPVFRLFQSELETVYEEKNRAMDNFIYPLLRAYMKQMFKNHPYGTQDIIGETDHLKNPSLIKMYEYFNTYYVANNMGLVLCGDFDSESVLPVIQAKFGKLPNRPVPGFPEYAEADFKGRESVEGKYTPIKIGLAGFRTVPYGAAEEPAIDVLVQLLSNQNQTGLLDQLVTEQQLLMAQVMSMPRTDHGMAMIIIGPKIVGQSIAKAEALVLDALRKVRLGEIEDSDLAIVKQQLRTQFLAQLEDIQTKGALAFEAFTSGQAWNDLMAYPDLVDKVTKADVQAMANKYFAENYFVLESKMGFPKKDKLEKPGYEPPVPPADAKSTYARYFESLPEVQPKARFVDFRTDVQQQIVKPNVVLLHVANPYNELFDLELRFGIGNLQDKRLQYVARFMEMIGTAEKDVTRLKKEFAVLGTTYGFVADDNEFSFMLSGMDKNLEASLELLNDFINSHFPDPSKIKQILSEEQSNRKFEEKDVQEIGRAVAERVRFGELAKGYNRLTLAEISKLNADSLSTLFKSVLNYACQAHYSGSLKVDEVGSILRKTMFQDIAPTLPASYTFKSVKPWEGKKVYFLDRKDARQSQMFFLKNLGAFRPEEAWLMAAFDEYFGGSMSGIVFQEVREFRSLAYSSGAPIRTPIRLGEPMQMIGFIGCQADKSKEALQVMHSLIDSMPRKADRIPNIRKAVIQSAYTERPNFRYLSDYVLDARQQGFSEDPSSFRLRFFEGLTAEALWKWYEGHIASQSSGNPTVTVVTGDSRQIPIKELQKYGEVVVLKMEDVFRN